MRKDTLGRPAQIQDIKKKIAKLRKANLSYTEIGKALGISRQLAFYHSQKSSTGRELDKEVSKNIMK